LSRMVWIGGEVLDRF